MLMKKKQIRFHVFYFFNKLHFIIYNNKSVQHMSITVCMT